MKSHQLWQCSEAEDGCGRQEADSSAWHHRLRQSWLKEADTCPERARRDHLGLDERRETDAANLGTGVHSAIETTLSEGQAGNELDEDTAVEVFNRQFTEMMAAENFEFVKYTEKSARNFGETCVRNWHRQILPTLEYQDAILEHTFQVPLVDDGQRVIELSGTIDYWEPDRSLRDWKTSGRGEYQPWEKKRWDIQSTIYCYSVCAIEEWWDPLTFEFIVMHPKGVQRLTVERTVDDFEWLKAKCVAYAKLIEAELDVWPMQDNQALCSPTWCDSWKNCRGKYLGDERPANWN